MKTKVIFFLSLFALAIPAFLAFRALFLPGPLAWGDAPYFYKEGLQELLAEPYGWVNRDQNFGGINTFLWLYPLMFTFGALHKLFGVDHDFLVRLVFYLPAVTSSFIGPVLLTRYLGLSRVAMFFASLVFGLNTYFLLLVDGGQLGVLLAYGISPLTLLFLRRLVDRPGMPAFLLGLVFLVVNLIADIRIALVSVAAVIIWVLVESLAYRKPKFILNLLLLTPLSIAAMGVMSYWLFPTYKLMGENLVLDISALQLISLLNPLFLFQPHWPLNEFGKISPPPFYFVGVPLLILGGLLIDRERRTLVLSLCFLLFAFLIKGGAEPLGEYYNWAVKNLPLGFTFRDSTKFFPPLLLFSGILVGLTLEGARKHLEKRSLFIFVLAAVYLYFLFLIRPALEGRLNGVLAGRTLSKDAIVAKERFQENGEFLRSVWFPERYPFDFHIEGKPALDGKDLVNERPFASMNVGTFNRFNFFHNDQSIEWLKLLGVKYLMFSSDFRKANLNADERADWENLLGLVSSLPGVEKTDWGQEFPIYKLPNSKPRLFSTDKLIAVVGSDNIYEKLKQDDKNNKFALANQAFVFLEDGRFDPSSLSKVASDSAVLVFNKRNEEDFLMSFFFTYFIGPKDSIHSQWAVRESREYLKWKYEFLINGVDAKEFDYNKGVAFSSQDNEEINYDLHAPRDGEYILALRGLNGKGEQLLKISFSGKEEVLPYKSEGVFEWFIKGPFQVKKGKHRLSVRNPGGFKAINVVALIPKKRWTEVDEFAKIILGKFEKIKMEDKKEVQSLQNILTKSGWHTVEYKIVSPVRYEVILPQNTGWLVFSDNYHEEWKLKKGKEFFNPYPFYSIINGFYYKPEWQSVEISFEGQKQVRWGLYFSTVSVFSLAILFLWLYPKKK